MDLWKLHFYCVISWNNPFQSNLCDIAWKDLYVSLNAWMCENVWMCEKKLRYCAWLGTPLEGLFTLTAKQHTLLFFWFPITQANTNMKNLLVLCVFLNALVWVRSRHVYDTKYKEKFRGKYCLTIQYTLFL